MAQEDPLERIALSRAAEFVAALNSGSPSNVRQAVARLFTQDAIVAPEGPWPDEHVVDGTWAVRWARTLHGLQLKTARTLEPGSVEVAAKEQHPLASGEALIDCRIERHPPHRIMRWSHRSAAEPAGAVAPAGPQAAVHEILANLDGAGLFSGAVLVQAGSERFVHAVGFADLQSGQLNTIETRFNTASLTKLFTAVAVLRLAEAGQIDLGAPIGIWLAERVPPALARLTSEQLLVHQGGLPEQVPDVEGAEAIKDDWLRPLSQVTLDSPPGSTWQYSNVGYSLLGGVIEHVTGLAYFDAMTQLVFAPSAMDATAFEDTSSRAPGRAVGYDYAPDQMLRPTVENCSSGLGRGAPYGYAMSTVGDIERLMVAIKDGRLLDSANAARLLAAAIPTGEPGRLAGPGLFTESHAGETLVTSAGAGPGISAWLDAANRRYLAIVLSNYPKPAAHRVGRFLRSRLLASPN